MKFLPAFRTASKCGKSGKTFIGILFLFLPIEVPRHASRFLLDFGAETTQKPLRALFRSFDVSCIGLCRVVDMFTVQI